jgi:hypothetical protein
MDNDNDPNQPYISYELAEDESDDEEEFRLRQIAVVAAVLYLGAEESRHERLARRKARRTYLIRGDLLPNPRTNTPYHGHRCNYIQLPSFCRIFSHSTDHK